MGHILGRSSELQATHVGTEGLGAEGTDLFSEQATSSHAPTKSENKAVIRRLASICCIVLPLNLRWVAGYTAI